jgi:hypothetical protein
MKEIDDVTREISEFQKEKAMLKEEMKYVMEG